MAMAMAIAAATKIEGARRGRSEAGKLTLVRRGEPVGARKEKERRGEGEGCHRNSRVACIKVHKRTRECELAKEGN